MTVCVFDYLCEGTLPKNIVVNGIHLQIGGQCYYLTEITLILYLTLIQLAHSFFKHLSIVKEICSIFGLLAENASSREDSAIDI